MNLPDAPIAYEGFLATHFFTMSDQTNRWIILNSGGGHRNPLRDVPSCADVFNSLMRSDHCFCGNPEGDLRSLCGKPRFFGDFPDDMRPGSRG